MLLNDVARDEELDILDPLRHLMEQLEDNDDIDTGDRLESKLLSVLPRQSNSVQNEIHMLSFVNDHDASHPPVTITLSVDASPGCGGIAWSAGQVRTLINHTDQNVCLRLSRYYPATSPIKAQALSRVEPSSN
jgi:hypothetical protein